MPLWIMGRRELTRARDGINATTQLVDNTSLERTKLALNQGAKARVGFWTPYMSSLEPCERNSQIQRLELGALIIRERIRKPSVPRDAVKDRAQDGVDARRIKAESEP